MPSHYPSVVVKACVGLLLCCFANAQDLEDYKGALAMAKKDGCTTASIPYPNIRDAAERKQADVTRWCKTEYRSCKGLETRSTREKINSIPTGIKNLEQQRDQLKSQLSSASDNDKSPMEEKIRNLQRQIDDLNKELDFTKKGLATDISDADKRVYNAKYCVQARKDINDPFKNAMSQANSVPASETEINAIAKQLVSIWQACEKEHEGAIREAQDLITYCEKAKNGDL